MNKNIDSMLDAQFADNGSQGGKEEELKDDPEFFNPAT